MPDLDPDVNRIVDRLFFNGYISRKENPARRRQKSAEITEKGLKLLEMICECETKAYSLLSNLTMEEVKELNRLLDSLRNHGDHA